ncbi:MAG: type II toxin-antitoxin system PemK/MazF family toxin [Thiotrichales bacterium]|nr:type II toxin-antitoxin system PemK/MazF family toxin [Thiotrichales bacterium]
MIFEPFDVVVVPFPFSDREAERRRPAVIVSSLDFNANHDQSVLAMITTAGGGEWPSDIAIRDWNEAGLSLPCKVRLKLFTLDDALILRRAGALSDRDAEAVRTSLVRFLAVDADGAFVSEPGGTYLEPEPLRQ